MTYVVLAVEVVVVGAIVFAVAALAMGRFDPMSTVRPDTRARPLPDGEVHAADVDRVRFGMVMRGYRMSEVDEVLRRLATELALRDEELNRRDEELEHLASFVRGDGSVGRAGSLPVDSARPEAGPLGTGPPAGAAGPPVAPDQPPEAPGTGGPVDSTTAGARHLGRDAVSRGAMGRDAVSPDAVTPEAVSPEAVSPTMTGTEAGRAEATGRRTATSAGPGGEES
jgi:DivIVA domain-containing protein